MNNKLKTVIKVFEAAEILFHNDLDGVTSAIALKNYLYYLGIKTVKVQAIQYGDREYSIYTPNKKNFCALVDFSKSKSYVHFHCDHHLPNATDTQKSLISIQQFAPSALELLQDKVLLIKQFNSLDTKIISMVDSANYLKHNITAEQTNKFFFKYNKEFTFEENYFQFGLVVNRLLLAYKNKPFFLENVVLNSSPSLISIYKNIQKEISIRNYPPVNEVEQNSKDFLKQITNNKDLGIRYRKGIVYVNWSKYTLKLGSFNRYLIFQLYPNADIVLTFWNFGTIQVSKNPFKRVDLGYNISEFISEKLYSYKEKLQQIIVPLSKIKENSEQFITFLHSKGKKNIYYMEKFKYSDLIYLYPKFEQLISLNHEELDLFKLNKIMSNIYVNLNNHDKYYLSQIGISLWDIIIRQTGGHEDIYNVSSWWYEEVILKQFIVDLFKSLILKGNDNND